MIKAIATVVILLLAALRADADTDTQHNGAERAMGRGIYDAAVLGDFSRVEELLKGDPISVNATDKFGFTPLHGVVGEHYFNRLAC